MICNNFKAENKKTVKKLKYADVKKMLVVMAT